jgi:hypothetical protein
MITIVERASGRKSVGSMPAKALVCALAMMACGDGSGDSTSITNDPPSGEVEPTVDENESPAVLYSELVDSPEGRSVYVQILPSLPTQPADRAQAYEFPNAYIWTHDGMVYIRDREAGTMTRYQVTDTLELVADKLADGADAMFSFQPLGLRPFGAPVVFISSTRAYVIDKWDMRVIVWNPTTMSISGTFPIENANKAGYDPPFLTSTVKVDDRVFAGADIWHNEETLDVHPGTGVLVFSATTDTPPALLEDPRITGASHVFSDAAGDVYVVGNQNGGLYNVMGPAVGTLPPAGVLRIKKGATDFDPDYFVDLNAVTDSQGIVSTYLLNDTTLVAQLWEPGVDVRSQITFADDYWTASEFVYGLVDLQTQTFSRLDTIPKAGVYSTLQLRTDGVLYLQVFNQVSEDVRNVDLYAVTPGGVQRAFAITAGELWNLDRIR